MIHHLDLDKLIFFQKDFEMKKVFYSLINLKCFLKYVLKWWNWFITYWEVICILTWILFHTKINFVHQGISVCGYDALKPLTTLFFNSGYYILCVFASWTLRSSDTIKLTYLISLDRHIKHQIDRTRKENSPLDT